MTLNDEYLLIIQYSLSGSYNSLFRTEVIECNVFKGKLAVLILYLDIFTYL